jgi:hypothetical protein
MKFDSVEDKRYRKQSFTETITEILRHHESAVSIIGDCESCRSKFREAVAAGVLVRKLEI